MPWVQLDSAHQGPDNFTPLTSLDWQVHVYGSATRDIRALSQERRLPLHEFAWLPAMGRAGLHRNGVYLVRPDGYVALAEADPSTSPLASYLDAHGIRCIA